MQTNPNQAHDDAMDWEDVQRGQLQPLPADASTDRDDFLDTAQ